MRYDQATRSVFQKSLGKIIFDVGAIGSIVVLSLLIFSFGLVNDFTVKLLIFLLFMCSVSLFIRRVESGLRLRRYGTISFLLGFIIWYSYPAFINFFIPAYQLDPIYYPKLCASVAFPKTKVPPAIVK